ncbi:MAG: hypothetical protein ABSD47_02690 [Candidatus Methylomirabilota bacterium]
MGECPGLGPHPPEIVLQHLVREDEGVVGEDVADGPRPPGVPTLVGAQDVVEFETRGEQGHEGFADALVRKLQDLFQERARAQELARIEQVAPFQVIVSNEVARLPPIRDRLVRNGQGVFHLQEIIRGSLIGPYVGPIRFLEALSVRGAYVANREHLILLRRIRSGRTSWDALDVRALGASVSSVIGHSPFEIDAMTTR